MTVTTIKERIEEIAFEDPETAHSLEDSLYEEVMRSIADGTCDDARACAAAVLETKDLDFERWYA